MKCDIVLCAVSLYLYSGTDLALCIFVACSGVDSSVAHTGSASISSHARTSPSVSAYERPRLLVTNARWGYAAPRPSPPPSSSNAYTVGPGSWGSTWSMIHIAMRVIIPLRYPQCCIIHACVIVTKLLVMILIIMVGISKLDRSNCVHKAKQIHWW